MHLLSALIILDLPFFFLAGIIISLAFFPSNGTTFSCEIFHFSLPFFLYSSFFVILSALHFHFFEAICPLSLFGLSAFGTCTHRVHTEKSHQWMENNFEKIDYKNGKDVNQKEEKRKRKSRKYLCTC